MSIFTGSLIIEEIKPGSLWKILEPVVYEVGTEGNGCFIIVPSGFETDGATIPFPIKTLMAVWGTYGRAAVVHDYLYDMIRKGTPHPHAKTRKQADIIFREAMKPLKTPKWLISIMFICVRAFGWRYI